MVTKEKLRYLKDNRQHGDTKAIADELKIGYNTVVQILRGAFYGDHGDAVVQAAEKLIKSRARRIRKEAKKFSNVPALGAGQTAF